MNWKRIADFMSRDQSVLIFCLGVVVPILVVSAVALGLLFGK